MSVFFPRPLPKDQVDLLASSLELSQQEIFEDLRSKATTTSVPTSATANGSPGQIAYDSSFLYVCTATNTWRRVAISAW